MIEILRPYAAFCDGKIESGFEFVVDGGSLVEKRALSAPPDSFFLLPCFVNAHSHLEYRGLQGAIHEPEYWGWIRELTARKAAQTPEEVASDCHLAAKENRLTGVVSIGEHSDRPFAGAALARSGLSGAIFQEVITFFEMESPEEKLASVRKKAEENAASFPGPVFLTPHAPYTVDPSTLAFLGRSEAPISIHVAETADENRFWISGEGAIADFYRRFDKPVTPTGQRVAAFLDGLGLARPGAQWVHACDLVEEDLDLVARQQVKIAHCPRTNTRLKSPIAPVREMLDRGIVVGIGLDSAASSGPIDFFAEIREAVRVSEQRGKPISAAEALTMATDWRVLPVDLPRRDLRPSAIGPWLAVDLPNLGSLEDLLAQGSPEVVRFVGMANP